MRSWSGDFCCSFLPTPNPKKHTANIGVTPATGAAIPLYKPKKPCNRKAPLNTNKHFFLYQRGIVTKLFKGLWNKMLKQIISVIFYTSLVLLEFFFLLSFHNTCIKSSAYFFPYGLHGTVKGSFIQRRLSWFCGWHGL